MGLINAFYCCGVWFYYISAVRYNPALNRTVTGIIILFGLTDFLVMIDEDMEVRVLSRLETILMFRWGGTRALRAYDYECLANWGHCGSIGAALAAVLLDNALNKRAWILSTLNLHPYVVFFVVWFCGFLGVVYIWATINTILREKWRGW